MATARRAGARLSSFARDWVPESLSHSHWQPCRAPWTRHFALYSFPSSGNLADTCEVAQRSSPGPPGLPTIPEHQGSNGERHPSASCNQRRGAIPAQAESWLLSRRGSLLPSGFGVSGVQDQRTLNPWRRQTTPVPYIPYTLTSHVSGAHRLHAPRHPHLAGSFFRPFHAAAAAPSSPPRAQVKAATATSAPPQANQQPPPPPSFGRFRDVELPVRNLQGEPCGTVTLPGSVFDVPIRKDIIHSVVRWQLAKRRRGTASTKGVGEVQGTSRKPYQQKGTGKARHGSLRGPQFRGGATMHGPKPRSYDYALPKKIRRLGLRIALSARVAEGKLVVYDELEPATHKTKNMADHLASSFPGSKKFLMVDQMAEVTASSTEASSPGASSESADAESVSASGTEAEAASAAQQAALSGEGLEDAALEQEQEEQGASVAEEQQQQVLRPLSKEERVALKHLKRQEHVLLQKTRWRLLKATGNLHYVNVLPTLGLNVYSILQHDTLLMSRAAVEGTIQRLMPESLSQRETLLVKSMESRE